MGLFDSLWGVATDVVEVATAPIEAGINIVRKTTKPLAEAVKDIVDATKGD